MYLNLSLAITGIRFTVYFHVSVFFSISVNELTITLCLQVRLNGGTGPHEGTVVLTYYGETGTICQNGFDRLDAVVICKMLGYDV